MYVQHKFINYVFVSHLYGCLFFLQDYVRKIEDKFGKGGTKLITMTPTQFTTALNNVYIDMKEGLHKFSPTALLKDYSPWLDTFQQDDYSYMIEVPGKVTFST